MMDPVAQGGCQYSAMEGGTAVSGTVTATDADGDLDPNGFALVGDVSEGSLTFNAQTALTASIRVPTSRTSAQW